MILGLCRHYYAFTIIFIQIIKLSFYWIGQVYAREFFAQIKGKKNYETVLAVVISIWIFSDWTVENLVSNITSVICTLYQEINQTDGRVF